jgi:hypothetical protein
MKSLARLGDNEVSALSRSGGWSPAAGSAGTDASTDSSIMLVRLGQPTDIPR